MAIILYYSTLTGTNRQILTPKRYDEHTRIFYTGFAPPPQDTYCNHVREMYRLIDTADHNSFSLHNLTLFQFKILRISPDGSNCHSKTNQTYLLFVTMGIDVASWRSCIGSFQPRAISANVSTNIYTNSTHLLVLCYQLLVYFNLSLILNCHSN